MFSSDEEDEKLPEFQKWLSSVAGSRKKPNDFKRMGNTLMSIVPQNGSREIGRSIIIIWLLHHF